MQLWRQNGFFYIMVSVSINFSVHCLSFVAEIFYLSVTKFHYFVNSLGLPIYQLFLAYQSNSCYLLPVKYRKAWNGWSSHYHPVEVSLSLAVESSSLILEWSCEKWKTNSVLYWLQGLPATPDTLPWGVTVSFGGENDSYNLWITWNPLRERLTAWLDGAWWSDFILPISLSTICDSTPLG